jgi:hypothetical protein
MPSPSTAASRCAVGAWWQKSRTASRSISATTRLRASRAVSFFFFFVFELVLIFVLVAIVVVLARRGGRLGTVEDGGASFSLLPAELGCTPERRQVVHTTKERKRRAKNESENEKDEPWGS